MPYTIETLDEGRIILQTFSKDFDMATDMARSWQECVALLDQSNHKMVLISDSRSLKLRNIEDIIQAANMARSSESKKLTQHPNLIKSVTITSSKVGHMAIKGLNSAAFGNLDIPVFQTMAAALDYARALLIYYNGVSS